MNINNLSDQQIIEFIATNIEKKRLSKNISSEQLAKDGGYNMQTYSNFINQGTNIKIKTVIQILRGLEQLDILQTLFEHKEQFSPIKASIIEAPKKRVHRKKPITITKWGDEI